MSNEIKWEMIAKYLSGECSAEEIKDFEEWLDNSEENRKLFNSMKKVWSASDENFEDSDIKALWEKVAEKSGIKGKSASAPVINIAPKENIFLKYSAIYNSAAFRYAAVFLLIVSASLIYFVTSNRLASDEMNIVTVKYGELESIVLNDGSKIIADAGSIVEYPENFGENSRDIKLSGEAYFEVSHNPDLPLRVYSGNAVIEVLGTKFNVRFWKESETINVAVIEGKVSFASVEVNNPVLLDKGFTSDLNKNGTMTEVRQVDTNQILSWLDGEMHFENARLSEVLAQLERWYNIEIILTDKSIESERLSVFIHNYSLLDNIDLISRLTSTRYTAEKNIITLTPAN